MSRRIDFETLFNSSPNPYMVLDRELRFVAANDAYLRVTGRRREELIGRNLFEAFPGNPDDPDDANVRLLRESFERVLTRRVPDSLALIRYTISRRTRDGVRSEERYWSATHTPIFDEQGEVALILQHTVDVTELQQRNKKARATESAREASVPAAQLEEGVLRRAQAVQETNRVLDRELRHLRRLFEQAPGFIAVLRGPRHVFELVNHAYDRLVGGRELLGKLLAEALPELKDQGFVELLDRVYETAEPFIGREVRVLLQREPGGPLAAVYVDFVYQPIVEADGSVSGIFVQGHDVTEQKRIRDELGRYRDHLEELVRERTRELEESQAALRQAQKMEAIGGLTGGVAHDFNNLLQIIGGNLQLLQRDIAGNEPALRRLETALSAVERGSRLASQLLAFARRQPLEPRGLNLGRLVRSMENLLRRAVGEAVEVEIMAAEDLWNTFADPHQLETAILNLAINARDAMDGVGRLTIEAGNAVLDEPYTMRHSDVVPGDYVLLAISDTGAGMPPEVRERALEPFFTTKPEGHGTGLGLSMVYGFVKQSGGHVKLYSEVGQGTTVKLYLPRTPEPEAAPSETADTPIEGGSETILVVEDDPAVRVTVVEMLADLGYRVLEASDGESALAVIRGGAHVDLLFTDVVMPGPIQSPQLASQAKALLPGLAVLFTSGYTETAIVHGGRLDPGIVLLSKPYRREDLARKIRQLLDRREQPGAAADPGATGDRAEPPPEPVPLRILLVEDDLALQQLLEEWMAELRHSTVAVSSAEEALAACEREAFDVLFSDVALPGMSGVALAREVAGRHPGVRVIFASGYGRSLPGDEGEEIAEAIVLSKPYSLDTIEEVLKQLAASRQALPQGK